jgi:hypothetical protein
MMKGLFRAEHRIAARLCRWLRRTGSGVLVLTLAFPGLAQPCSLDYLLRLPLERLLQIKIVPRPVAAALNPGAMALKRLPAAGRVP